MATSWTLDTWFAVVSLAIGGGALAYEICKRSYLALGLVGALIIGFGLFEHWQFRTRINDLSSKIVSQVRVQNMTFDELRIDLGYPGNAFLRQALDELETHQRLTSEIRQFADNYNRLRVRNVRVYMAGSASRGS